LLKWIFLPPKGVDEERDEHPEDEERGHDRGPPLVVVQGLPLASHGAPG